MPAAPQWRGSARIWLLEREPGELAALERLLGRLPVETARSVQEALPAGLPPDAVVLALGPDLGGLLARLSTRWEGYQPPLLGHCAEADGLMLSRGLALGCCDVLHGGLPPEAVVSILARATELGLLRRELAGRLRLLESFTSPVPGEAPPPEPPPALLLLGPASEEQVEIARAVGQARIAYGHQLEHVAGDAFDLVILTRAPGNSALAPRLRGEGVVLATAGEGRKGACTIGTVGEARRPLIDPFGDPLRMRMQLRFWIAFARTRRRLRGLPDGRQHALARDCLTGLGNFAFLASYLEALTAQGGEAPLLAIGLPALEHVNREHGYAEGNRLLGEAGRLLREHSRAGDLLARIGGGFLCLPSVSEGETLAAMAARLTAVLGRLPGEPAPLVLVSSSRRGELATRTIHRVRRELRAELARAA